MIKAMYLIIIFWNDPTMGDLYLRHPIPYPVTLTECRDMRDHMVNALIGDDGSRLGMIPECALIVDTMMHGDHDAG